MRVRLACLLLSRLRAKPLHQSQCHVPGTGNGQAVGPVRETFRMPKLDAVMDIKMAALFLRKNLMGRNPEVVRSAENELAGLVDRFYAENGDLLSPGQYRTARSDYDYFMILIEMAIEHYMAKGPRE
jgi:hypothetical protein